MSWKAYVAVVAGMATVVTMLFVLFKPDPQAGVKRKVAEEVVAPMLRHQEQRVDSLAQVADSFQMILRQLTVDLEAARMAPGGTVRMRPVPQVRDLDELLIEVRAGRRLAALDWNRRLEERAWLLTLYCENDLRRKRSSACNQYR